MSNFKLPHWALLALSLASAALAWLVAHTSNGDVVLPAAVLGVIPIAQAVIGMLSPSVSTSTNLAAVKRAGGAMLGACLLVVVAQNNACTPAQDASAITLGVDTAICILKNEFTLVDGGIHVANDPGEIALTCIGENTADTVALVTGVLAAHKAAEAREASGPMPAVSP
jgi:hypothetical protein